MNPFYFQRRPTYRSQNGFKFGEFLQKCLFKPTSGRSWLKRKKIEKEFEE